MSENPVVESQFTITLHFKLLCFFAYALLFCCCFFARFAFLLLYCVAFLLAVAFLLGSCLCFFALLLFCSGLCIAFLLFLPFCYFSKKAKHAKKQRQLPSEKATDVKKQKSKQCVAFLLLLFCSFACRTLFTRTKIKVQIFSETVRFLPSCVLSSRKANLVHNL